MADAIARTIEGEESAAIVGIRTHGVTIAQRIQKLVQEKTGREIPLGIQDITLYRDDLHTRIAQPVVRPTEIAFDLDDRLVILVDDVLFTGRTIRCALEELMDYGRPRAIRLAVLVDRGHREMPIQPDFTGIQVETKREEKVLAHFQEKEGEDRIWME